MAGKNDLIKILRTAIGEFKYNSIFGPPDRLHRCVQFEPVSESFDDFVDIGAGTSLQHPPDRTVVSLKHFMIGEEIGEELHGES